MTDKKLSELYQVVFSYETKHDEGFTSDEIKQLCDKYKVDINKLNNALGINTGIIINSDFLFDHTDVYYAMKKCLGYSLSVSEWD